MKPDIKKILAQAEQTCTQKDVRLTESRRYVLAIIASSSKPLGAYDILKSLSRKMDNPKPPTVYRAIEFLQAQGFIHRIESLNAYVICDAHHHHTGSQFMVCDDCGKVTEAHLCDLPTPLLDKTKKENFKLSSWNVELHGLCAGCQ